MLFNFVLDEVLHNNNNSSSKDFKLCWLNLVLTSLHENGLK